MLESRSPQSDVEHSLFYDQGSLLASPDLLFDRVLDAKYFFVDDEGRKEWLNEKFLPWLLSQWCVIEEKLRFAPFRPATVLGKSERTLTLGLGKTLREETTTNNDRTNVRFTYNPQYPHWQINDVLVIDFVAESESRKLLTVGAELVKNERMHGGLVQKGVVRVLYVDAVGGTLSSSGTGTTGLKI